jgi:hypothetical protein
VNDGRELYDQVELGLVDLSDIACYWCGCMQDSSCVPPCWWVEVNLANSTGTCSSCGGIQE